MRNIITLTTLGVIISGVVFAVVIPNIGKGKDEVLIRTWTETEKVTETIDSSKVPIRQAKVIKPQEQLSQVKTDTSTVKPAKKQKTSSKVHSVTKSEKLKLRPLKFSRAMQFEPIEEVFIVSDTIIEVMETDSATSVQSLR